jgi:hypothetical protein
VIIQRTTPVDADFRSVRVPRDHGEALVHPSKDRITGLLADNLTIGHQSSDYDILGCSLAELRHHARRDLLEDARNYTSAYRDVQLAADAESPLLLAGHQPQLFHAGVWFKSFALSQLAARHRAHAVNLVIDNDIHRISSLRVPKDTRSGQSIRTLLFDRGAEAIPYEERQILDRSVFATFGERVERSLNGLVPDPLIQKLWPLAQQASKRSNNLGRCLAEARHSLEACYDQQTWELPLSQVCNTPWFAQFASHLLAHLPRLQDVYNTSLAEYRRVNRVRSRSHPVPDLVSDGLWLEAPFWIWTADSPHRQRMFVRACGDGLEISDRRHVTFSLDVAPDRSADRAVEQWLSQEARGVRMRPRALLTTMYARLVLGDLFLHGIGGGKYDQLTDRIIRRFFELQPPHYLMISATALLFEDHTAELRDRIQSLRQRLRELRYHPEKHAIPSQEVARLTREKFTHIYAAVSDGQGRARHLAIEGLNAALQTHSTMSPQQAFLELEACATDLRRQSALASRDFSFCLFSEQMLCPLLMDLAQSAV